MIRRKSDGGWTCLDREYLFQSQWFNLRQDQVRLPNDDRITYTLVEHPGYVLVVALLEGGSLLMERVYRYTVQETVLECPSGGVDKDPPEVAAHRELREETGYAAEKMEKLGSFFGSNGISNEEFHVFLARGLTCAGAPELENTEQIELEELSFDVAYQMALRGEISDAPSAYGIILAWHRIHGKN